MMEAETPCKSGSSNNNSNNINKNKTTTTTIKEMARARLFRSTIVMLSRDRNRRLRRQCGDRLCKN